MPMKISELEFGEDGLDVSHGLTLKHSIVCVTCSIGSTTVLAKLGSENWSLGYVQLIEQIDKSVCILLRISSLVGPHVRVNNKCHLGKYVRRHLSMILHQSGSVIGVVVRSCNKNHSLDSNIKYRIGHWAHAFIG